MPRPFVLPINLCRKSNYETDQLITYIGNKRKLVGDILEFADIARKELGTDTLRTGDFFSGSGVVARALTKVARSITAVDSEPYSKAINDCYLRTNKNIPSVALENIYFAFSRQAVMDEMMNYPLASTFFRDHYAPKDDNNIQKGERCFYTHENALRLDVIKSAIIRTLGTDEEWLYNFFIAPLLSEASVKCNTCGIFKGFYKGKDGIGKFGGEKEAALERIKREIWLEYPNTPIKDDAFNKISTTAVLSDVNRFVERDYCKYDFVYLDPPYNQHPYGSNYFMLNLLADRKCEYLDWPEETFSTVSGIPNNWYRSKYNKKKYSKELLFELIENINSDFICLSYNSTGFIEYNEIVEFLKLRGSLKIKEIVYPSFRGSRNYNTEKKKVTEYLFLLDKRGKML